MSKKLPKPLYEEALEILERSETLRQTVLWQEGQANKLVRKYSEEVFEGLSWDEKERHLMECEEVMGRLNQSAKELEVLDERYRVLREKLKKHFGREVLPPLNGDIWKKITPEDEIEL